MKLPQLIVSGEALTDFIREDGPRWRSAAGGSCWNVARLGVPVATLLAAPEPCMNLDD
jgi:fructokinase